MALYKVIRSFVKFIDEILNGMAKGVVESISADRGHVKSVEVTQLLLANKSQRKNKRKNC